MSQPPTPPDDDEVSESAAAAEFAAALESFERTKGPAAPAPSGAAARRAQPAIRVGARLACRVVSVSGDTVLFDIGGRSEGVAEAREFRLDDGTLSVAEGQTIELFVVEAGEQVVLARTARTKGGGGKARPSLDGVRQARTAEVPVRGKVTAVNTGGLAVDIDGVRAFCPLSQIDAVFVEDPAPFVGRVLEFLVTEVDESRHRVVVSRKRLLQREHAEQARARLATIAPGQELEGTVSRMEPFGAFVDLGGIDGLVHVSEVSHARIAHPREVLSAGEKVHVKVLKVEPGKDGRPRIALSIRAAAPDPWVTAVEKFTPGARVSGVVVRLADFGAFVNLAPGIDGLVHVSQVSDRRIQHVREVLSPGQAVEAIVLAVEPERKRISLSLREAQDVAPSHVSEEGAPAGRPAPKRGARPAAGRGARPAAERGARPAAGRAARPAAEREDWAPPPRPVDDSPTAMQLAFRRAREAAERREQKK
jgi:small subunit ribosomal protein S1